MNRVYGTSLLVAALSVIALLGSASAQDVQQQIKKLETDRAAAVVKGDVAKLEEETSDDATFINRNGQLMDKVQTINAIKSGDIKLISNDLSDLKVRVYGDTAVLTGKSDTRGTIGGKQVTGPMMFTRVYVKKNGRWQSVAFQQTPVINP